jgi:hypothetical protein
MGGGCRVGALFGDGPSAVNGLEDDRKERMTIFLEWQKKMIKEKKGGVFQLPPFVRGLVTYKP